jgi:hypothetical protein
MEAWITAAKAEDKREKLHALSLAKECCAIKLDLLTNAAVVDHTIRFVSERSKKDRLTSDEEESGSTAATTAASHQVF